MFLRNHDELDLGRLTEEQRETVFDAFGPEQDMQLYDRGIRRRLAPMLDGDRRRLELAYSLMFTLPGTPVIRYGDELGMGDDLDLPERNCARTPMQWSTEPHGGFTKSEKPIVPVIDEGPYGYEHVNAAEQRRDPDSMLNWTERIIRMRKEVPEIGWGDFAVLDERAIPPCSPCATTGATTRCCSCTTWTRNRASFFSMSNVGEAGQAAGQSPDRGSQQSADESGKHRVVLEGYAYRWYRVGGLDYLLKRTDI